MVWVLALLGLGVLIAVFGGGGFLALLGVVVVYPTAAYMGYAVCAKRWHDRNKSRVVVPHRADRYRSRLDGDRVGIPRRD